MSKRSRSLTTARRSPLPWLGAALLMIAVFLAYRPAASGTFIWDDDDYVSKNPNLRTPSGLANIWFHPTRSPQYYPMTFTTFWIEHQIWGDDARGYHEINILLHATSALLLWQILKRLRIPGAFVAAAIFALHPVMVESVAWITERKNTLSLLFYLASMNAYLRFARIDADNEMHTTDWRTYAISLAFFLCALGSKTVTATLPAALLLILWWKQRLHRRHVALLAPFFLVGIAAALHTSFLERSEVGASGSEWSYTAPQRILIASRAICFYASQLLWPANLTFVYPKWPIDQANLSQWLVPLALLLIVALLLTLRHRIGRGPLAATLFFIGTLVPALGFVNVYPMRYTFVADHYQYHASLGLIVLVVAAISTHFQQRNLNRRFPRAAPAVVALVLLTLAILTFLRAQSYRNPQTLWTDTVHKNPNSWMAWLNLGHVAATASPPDLAAAADAYRKAVALAPDVADPHFNIGLIHLAQQDYPAADAEFTRAIALNPRHAGAHDMLGLCLVAQHQPQAGIAQYRLALAIKPRDATAHFNLGVALRDTGQLDDAATEFTTAIDLDPSNPLPLRELANYRIHQKNYPAAIDPLERLLKLQPNNAEAHFDLAAALALTNHPEESNDHLRQALALKPELQSRWKR